MKSNDKIVNHINNIEILAHQLNDVGEPLSDPTI
jgi:hypothetical protein